MIQTQTLPVTLRRHLSRARRRLHLAAALMTSARLVALVGGVTLVALWAAPALGVGFARVVAWVLIGATVGILAFDLIKPLWRARGLTQVAAELERRVPRLRDGLLTCVQLYAAPERPRLLPALTAQVDRQLTAAALPTIIRLTPPRRWALGALLVFTAGALSWALAPERVEEGLGQLHVGPAPATLSGPLVGDLTLTITYPAHFNRPARVLKNTTGPLRAPKGSRVEIRATTLSPAAALTLRLGEEAIPLTLEEEREGTGAFEVKGGAEWRFAVETLEGAELVEAEPRALLIEPDSPPRVRMLIPEQDLELDDPRALNVAFDVADDLGVSKLAAELALAADPEHPEAIELMRPKGKRFRAEDSVDLTRIEAQGGDRLALTLKVWDNNGVDGPQVGVSQTRYITIRSPKARHYALTDKLKGLLEALLISLADRLVLDWAHPAPLRPRVEALHAQTLAATEKLAEVTREMVDDPLTAAEIREALDKQLEALESAQVEEAKRWAQIRVAVEQRHAPSVEAIKALNEGVIAQLESTIILVEAMTARLALEDMAALAEEIRAAREDLKALIEAYRDRPDAHLKKRIMRDIRRLQRQIDEIRARMQALRQRLPEEFLNIEGMKKGELSKGLSDTKDQLDKLEEMLDKGEIDEALKALEEMSEALDQLSDALNNDMQELHNETNPERQRILSEMMDQARDLMKRQAEISAETEQVAQAEAEALKEMLDEEMEGPLKALLRKVARLRLAVERIPPDIKRPFFAEDSLEHLIQRVDELYALVEEKKIYNALDAAERAGGHLSDLRGASRYARDAERALKILDEAYEIDEDIIRDLLELLEQARRQARRQRRAALEQQTALPQPADAPSSASGQQEKKRAGEDRSQGLPQRQRAAADETREMERRMQEAQAQLPGLDGAPRQQLQQAREAMEQAARQLQRRRPRGARPAQEDATRALQGLMEGLKQAGKPQKGQRGQQQQQQRRLSQEKVRVPGADEHRAPAAFREELMEAMKGRAPEEFQESVKRYYESLVE